MELSAYVRELLELRKQEVVLLEKIASALQSKSDNIENATSLPADSEQHYFKSTADAIRHVLGKADKPLHVNEIIDVLSKQYGLTVNKIGAAAMMRKYAATGRDFKAVGGNRFTLLEKKEDKTK